jgi:hypothetical protein
MKPLLALCSLIASTSVAQEQELVFVKAFDDTVFFAPPSDERWEVQQNEYDSTHNRYVLTWSRFPIVDSLGRTVQPMIALILEPVADSTDVILYSVWKRRYTKFEVKRVFSDEHDEFSYPNVIAFDGFYDKANVRHSVFVAHMIHRRTGIQIICDSTEELFHLVEDDMRNFGKSVQFDE